MGEDLGIYNTYKRLKYKQMALSGLNKELMKDDMPEQMEQPEQPQQESLTPEQLRMIMKPNQK